MSGKKNLYEGNILWQDDMRPWDTTCGFFIIQEEKIA